MLIFFFEPDHIIVFFFATAFTICDKRNYFLKYEIIFRVYFVILNLKKILHIVILILLPYLPRPRGCFKSIHEKQISFKTAFNNFTIFEHNRHRNYITKQEYDEI